MENGTPQRQKGIPSTISKDPVDDHETYIVRKGEYIEIKKYTLLFPSIPTTNAKKPRPTFCLLSSSSITANEYTICKS